MENLPVCTQEAAFILCVSPECADMVACRFRKERRYGSFQNCVEAEYFEGSGEYAGYKRALDKIAIISNHIPQELLELKVKDGRVLSGGSDRTWVSYGTGECRDFCSSMIWSLRLEEPYRGVLQWAFRFMFMIIWEVPDI